MKRILVLLIVALFFGCSKSDFEEVQEKTTEMALPQTDISINAVRQVLGENTYSLAALCTSSNINKWARYRPGGYDNAPGFIMTAQNYLDGIYTIKLPAGGPLDPYSLGDFRGYNHLAEPSLFFKSVYNITMERGTSYNYVGGLEQGERIPVHPQASLDNIDIEAYVGGDLIETINMNNPEELNFDLPIFVLNSTTVTLKGFYKYLGSRIAKIEGGDATFNVTVIPLQVTAVISNIQMNYINGFNLTCDVTLTRTGTSTLTSDYKVTVAHSEGTDPDFYGEQVNSSITLAPGQQITFGVNISISGDFSHIDQEFVQISVYAVKNGHEEFLTSNL